MCLNKEGILRAQYPMTSEQIFVSKYQMYLPTVEELKAELERDVLELGENNK